MRKLYLDAPSANGIAKWNAGRLLPWSVKFKLLEGLQKSAFQVVLYEINQFRVYKNTNLTKIISVHFRN
jgi:hypothetical protein